MLGILAYITFGKLILDLLDDSHPGCSRRRIVLLDPLLSRLHSFSDFTYAEGHIGYCESNFPELVVRMEKHDWFGEIELIVAYDLHDWSYDNVDMKNFRD